MEITQILAFTVVALLLVVSPGPNGLLIAKTVPVSGRAAGFANVAGFVTAFYVHGVLSVLGISVLLTKSEELFFVVKLVGALYLMWVGVKALMSAFQVQQGQEITIRKSKRTFVKAYIEGFLTNVLNPKVSMFYLAAFPQFIPMGNDAILFGFMLVSIHALMNMFWFTGMVLLISKVSMFTKKYVFQRLLKSVTGIIFIGFGAKLLTLKAE